MILQAEHFSNIEQTKNMIVDRDQQLTTMIDAQVILQLLVQKGIFTREEVSEMRNIVRNSERYKLASQWIDQAKKDLLLYETDPQAILQELIRQKMEK